MRRRELWPESDPQRLVFYISDDEDEESDDEDCFAMEGVEESRS
jgi:hypothetical protein